MQDHLQLEKSSTKAEVLYHILFHDICTQGERYIFCGLPGVGRPIIS
jgi:hypothetical protein